MSYSISFEKQTIKFLLKLERKTSKRILDKIEGLKEHPVPHNAKRIMNINDKVFRIRIGNYRVLYRIEKEKIIIIFFIEKRSKVYYK